MATLNVNIGALELKNPVMTASGTFGYGLEFADLVPLDWRHHSKRNNPEAKTGQRLPTYGRDTTGNAELCRPAE